MIWLFLTLIALADPPEGSPIANTGTPVSDMTVPALDAPKGPVGTDALPGLSGAEGRQIAQEPAVLPTPRRSQGHVSAPAAHPEPAITTHPMGALPQIDAPPSPRPAPGDAATDHNGEGAEHAEPHPPAGGHGAPVPGAIPADPSAQQHTSAPGTPDLAGDLAPDNVPVQRSAPALTPPLLDDAATSASLFPPLPQVRVRGFWNGVWLALVTILLLAGARLLAGLRSNLLSAGLLPSLTSLGANGLRLGALYTAFKALGAIVPESLAPGLPFMLLGGALAVGWSLRDLLPDIVAGLTLSLERRVSVGQWLEGPGFAGTVEHIGVRAIWLSESDGRRVVIPHRQLMDASVTNDTERYPASSCSLRVPPHWPTADARARLTELAITSPWIAPGHRPTVARSTDDEALWTVRCRLLEGRFARQHATALRDRLDRLGQSHPPDAPNNDGVP